MASFAYHQYQPNEALTKNVTHRFFLKNILHQSSTFN